MKNKPYDHWNKNKKEVDQIDPVKLFRKGEIWWVTAGINIGIEQNGKNQNFARPVLILKKYNPNHFLALPLTTQKVSEKFSFHLPSSTAFLTKESWIVFSQIRAMDSKRLRRRMGKVSENIFNDIQKKLIKHITLNP